jgi:hypothetical protein
MNRPTLTPQQQKALTAFAQQNPGVPIPGMGMGAPPLPGGNSFGTVCGFDRVALAGGQLTSYITPSSIIPLEFVYRRLPEDGIFDATPSKPCEFDLGTLKVPIASGFVLLDYNFDIYRPSGSASDDFVPLEDNRLSTQVGWDIQSNAARPGNYRFELNPTPPQDNSSNFQSMPNAGLIPGGPPAPASDDQFTQARYAQAQSATSQGLSLMPQRHHRQGLLHVPASWVLRSTQSLTVSCTVFRAIQIPIAFFEASIFGFIMADANFEALDRALAVCEGVGGGV